MRRSLVSPLDTPSTSPAPTAEPEHAALLDHFPHRLLLRLGGSICLSEDPEEIVVFIDNTKPAHCIAAWCQERVGSSS